MRTLWFFRQKGWPDAHIGQTAMSIYPSLIEEQCRVMLGNTLSFAKQGQRCDVKNIKEVGWTIGDDN
jgi:hypothetical protein